MSLGGTIVYLSGLPLSTSIYPFSFNLLKTFYTLDLGTCDSVLISLGVPVMMVLKLRYTCASYVLSPNFCNECIVLSCKFTLPLF